jgi:hypothetical protein
VSTALDQLQFDAIAWQPDPGMSFEHYVEAGRALGRVTRACQFLLGDWVNHGELRFAEQFDQIASVTGYDDGTLRNFATVAGQIPPSRRHERLTFSHHQVVATIKDPDLQDQLLARAASERLTVDKLKAEVRAFRTALPKPEPQSEALPDPAWSEPPGVERAVEAVRSAIRALAAVSEAAEHVAAAWAPGADVEVIVDGVVR